MYGKLLVHFHVAFDYIYSGGGGCSVRDLAVAYCIGWENVNRHTPHEIMSKVKKTVSMLYPRNVFERLHRRNQKRIRKINVCFTHEKVAYDNLILDTKSLVTTQGSNV